LTGERTNPNVDETLCSGSEREGAKETRWAAYNSLHSDGRFEAEVGSRGDLPIEELIVLASQTKRDASRRGQHDDPQRQLILGLL
jgi:hypothetical protein